MVTAMRDNVKAILKNRPFNYDEDNFYLVDVDDYFADLGDKSEDTVIELIRCGMNNQKGFDRKIKRSLKVVLKLRKQFLTVELVPGGKAAMRFEAQFAKAEKSAKKLVDEKNESIKRFDHHLEKHFERAKYWTKELAESFEQNRSLRNVCNSSMNILNSIIQSRENVLDVSSTNAEKYAENILAHIDEWKEKLAEAIEIGRVDNDSIKQLILEPLNNAKKEAENWENTTEGITASNPKFIEAIKEYDESRDLLCSLAKEIAVNPAGFNDIVSATRSNQEMLQTISGCLNGAVSESNRRRVAQEDRETCEELIEIFSAKSHLLGEMDQSGYTQSRLRSEETLRGFLQVERDLFEIIKVALNSTGAVEKEDIHSYVEQIKSNYIAWNDTHSCEWKRGIVMDNKANMEARSQLAKIFGKTIEELESLLETAQYLTKEEKTENLMKKAREMKNRFSAMKESILTKPFTDTKANVESAKEVVGMINELRGGMFKDSMQERQLDSAIKKIENKISEMQKPSFSFGKEKHPQIGEIKSDELSSSIEVLVWIDFNKTFFDMYETRKKEAKGAKQKLVNKSEDEEYKECLERINEIKSLARSLSNEEYQLRKEELSMQLDVAKEALKNREEAIADENNYLMSLMHQELNGASYDAVVNKLKMLYRKFTGSARVSYSERAALLKEYQIGSLEDLFTKLQDSAMAGKEGEVKAIINRVIGVEKALAKREGSVKAGFDGIKKTQSIMDTNKSKENAEVKATREELFGRTEKAPVQTQSMNELDDLRGPVNEQPVKETQQPVKETESAVKEAGVVEDVNVSEEKEVDDLVASFLKKDII